MFTHFSGSGSHLVNPAPHQLFGGARSSFVIRVARLFVWQVDIVVIVGGLTMSDHVKKAISPTLREFVAKGTYSAMEVFKQDGGSLQGSWFIGESAGC